MTVPKEATTPDMLRLAVAAVLEADKEFRANMPPEWEGDPLSDEIDGLRRVFSSTLPIAGEVKVKALEFASYRDSEGSAPRWKAEHTFGEYRIILNTRDMEYWSPQFGGLTGNAWTSLEAAKAAAQSDFETRILSALVWGGK